MDSLLLYYGWNIGMDNWNSNFIYTNIFRLYYNDIYIDDSNISIEMNKIIPINTNISSLISIFDWKR